MSLIKCPSCNAWTSDQVSACVQCGLVISEHDDSIQHPHSSTENAEHTPEADPFGEAEAYARASLKQEKGYFNYNQKPEIESTPRRSIWLKVLILMVAVSGVWYYWQFNFKGPYIGGSEIRVAARTGVAYDIDPGRGPWEVKLQVKHLTGASLFIYVTPEKLPEGACGSPKGRDLSYKYLYKEKFRGTYSSPWIQIGQTKTLYLSIQNCQSIGSVVSAKLFYRHPE